MSSKLLLNRWVVFLLILGSSIALGLACGVAVYVTAPVILPWLTEMQRKASLWGFTLIGVIVGMCAATYDLVRNWKYRTELYRASRLRKGSGGTDRE